MPLWVVHNADYSRAANALGVGLSAPFPPSPFPRSAPYRAERCPSLSGRPLLYGGSLPSPSPRAPLPPWGCISFIGVCPVALGPVASPRPVLGSLRSLCFKRGRGVASLPSAMAVARYAHNNTRYGTHNCQLNVTIRP